MNDLDRCMPPEWHPHSATWMAFPRDSYQDSGLTREAVQRAWSDVANAISEHEPLHMLCHPEDKSTAIKMLSGKIHIHAVPLNDAWLRDMGPTFVLQNEELIAVDWRFNGWGQNTEFCWEHDDKIAQYIADLAGARIDRTDLVNEGGGIHVDGHGWVLLTETVQLDPHRNPNYSRKKIIDIINTLLGTSQAIWLPKGLYRDYFLNGTRGHVDMVACFSPKRQILLHRQEDPGHPDYFLWELIKRSLDDTEFEIIPLPAPTTLRDNKDWVDYSYINHYVCNGAVICPVFSDPNDGKAQEILSNSYPDRDIIGMECREIFAMGGGIHCITQQQPRIESFTASKLIM